MPIQSVNPATEEVLETFAPHDDTRVDAALRRAEAAFADWRAAGFDERARVLARAAEILRDERAEHGRQMTLEMGKPLVQAEAEADKCAWVCEFYAEHAERFLAPESLPSDADRSYARFDPLGPVLAVMPWNFPYWQVFRALAPALMAGNPLLLKHASNVPRCALNVEDVLRRAGAPDGVFQTLLVPARTASAIIARPEIRAVTLTGSEPAGREVAARAGEHLKKSVLELGGSDPFIVLEDADPAAAARHAVTARTLNTGQSCIAAKRFLVVDRIADAFVEAFAAALEALVVGDPLERGTDLGPLARADLVDDLEDQLTRARQGGARVVTGGRRLEGPGYFYAPTLAVDVGPESPIAAEETFGPLAAVIRVADEDRAVEVANASRFGLGASVWSGDAGRAERLAPRLEAGCVAINGIVKSDPRLPFGGVKASGFGRELGGAFGIREFVNVKAVWLAEKLA